MTLQERIFDILTDIQDLYKGLNEANLHASEEIAELLEQSKTDDFETAIQELGFVRNEKLSDKLMIEHEEYLLEYEGYAYVLYKIVKKDFHNTVLQLKEPIAHFQDANKLKAFVNILKDEF